jgi:hypothetical protein
MLACLLKDKVVSFPEVGKAGLVAKPLRDACPEHFAAFHAVISHEKATILHVLRLFTVQSHRFWLFFGQNAATRRTPVRPTCWARPKE